jgi:hypothetical protein
MLRRTNSFRALVVSTLLALAIGLIPLATALADGVPSKFPR